MEEIGKFLLIFMLELDSIVLTEETNEKIEKIKSDIQNVLSQTDYKMSDSLVKSFETLLNYSKHPQKMNAGEYFNRAKNNLKHELSNLFEDIKG